MTIPVNLLVEGTLDEAVGRRLITEVGGIPGVSFGKQGFGYIQKKITGFNASAERVPLLTLVDLADTRVDCPADAVRHWLPNPKARMIFRLVVWEIEGWLLADRKGIAGFLGVSASKVPHEPETLRDPKTQMVSLAKSCRNRRLREALAPAPGTSATTGPLYNSELARFALRIWDPAEAARVSESLGKCITRLRAVVSAVRDRPK